MTAQFLDQVHGTRCLPLDAVLDTPVAPQADASITAQAGLACVVMVADCRPVLFTDRQGRRVAAAHAGWRGLAGEHGQGVLEAVVASYAAGGQGVPMVAPQDMLAWLGPCIGPREFEVGADVHAAFCAVDPEAATALVPT